MDYSELTVEQRSACIRLLCQLQGRVWRSMDSSEFTGQARLAHTVAMQEAEGIIVRELERLLDSAG